MINKDKYIALSNKIRSLNGFIHSTADDLIKAQDALIETNKVFLELVEDVRRDGWVSVTEGLPKDDEVVLVTRLYIEGRKRSPKPFVDVGNVYGGRWTFASDEYAPGKKGLTDPIAWMPLPKPYMEWRKGKPNERDVC